MHFALALPGESYRSLHGAPSMTSEDQWAFELVKSLDSAVIKRSDIIEVSFHAHDPLWAQRFLTLLINHYLDFHARISHDPQAEQFFQQQAQLLQEKLGKSQQQLNDFELKTGISNYSAQQQATITRLSSQQTERGKAEADLASAQEQVTALSSLLTSTPQHIGKETKSVQNLALTQLKPQVVQLKAERADLFSRYQPDSRRIKEIDAKLAAAQQILDQENHLEVTEQSTDLNPVWVTIDQNLAQAKGNAAAARATMAKLDDEIDRTQKQMDFLVNNSSEFDELERQVSSDKQALDAYVRKTEEARAAGALNSNKILNVSVAQPPLRPLKPVFPVVWLNLFAGFVFSIVLAIAAVEVEERRDPRIYSTYTVARDVGLPSIGVISSHS